MVQVGDIVKYLNWVGVVQEIYHGKQNSGDIHLKIWFVKNIFQGKSYDLVPYDPDDELGRLQPATKDDLKANIVEYLQDAQAQCEKLANMAIT
ncbi:MAG: hypothetical protein JXA42_21040 [Anaerolineales bacterium]|nr:hypothetical protein [Anaerolineales bacterium]